MTDGAPREPLRRQVGDAAVLGVLPGAAAPGEGGLLANAAGHSHLGGQGGGAALHVRLLRQQHLGAVQICADGQFPSQKLSTQIRGKAAYASLP